MKKLKKRPLKKIILPELEDFNISKNIHKQVDLEGYTDKPSTETYYIKAKIEGVENEDVLVLSFFKITPPDPKPFFVIYLASEDFISLAPNENKWVTGRLNSNAILKNDFQSRYVYELGYQIGNMVLIEDSDQIIRDFFKDAYNKKIDPGKEIREVLAQQLRILEDRLLKKHEKITREIDEKMAPVPECPRDFDNWIKDTALYRSRYIFYNYTGKKIMNGMCSHCHEAVEIEGPKHNQEGICPGCNSPITYKASKRQKNIIDYCHVSLLQRVGQEVLQRVFFVRKKYNIFPDSLNLTFELEIALSVDETERTFFPVTKRDQGKLLPVSEYKWGLFMQTGKFRWCNKEVQEGLYYNSHREESALYTKNLDEVLKGTLYQYSGIKLLAENTPGYPFLVEGYLLAGIHYPWIEYLCKQKMFLLAKETAKRTVGSSGYHGSLNGAINPEAKKPEEIFELPANDFALIKNINGGFEDISLIKRLKETNMVLKEEQLNYLSKNHLQRERRLFNFKYSTLPKLLKYLRQQHRKHKKVQVKDICIDYFDYIAFCEELKKDLSNLYYLFPPDYKKAHDGAHKELEEARDKIKQDKIKKNSQKIKRMSQGLKDKFSLSFKGLTIVVPESAKEIEQEGECLHHCVSSYVERMAKKETVILFIRKKADPKTPFYTLEVKDNDIQQCRGSLNKSYTGEPQVRAFVDKFKALKLIREEGSHVYR